MADLMREAKPVWPDRLTLRDTRVHADEGQRIFTTATGYGYEKQEYVRADLARPAAPEGVELRWASIPGYENYEVSNFGTVRNTQTGRILSINYADRGYGRVSISNSKGPWQAPLGRLVLMGFAGLPAAGMAAAHLNGVRSDNRLSNLRWVTYTENEAHKKTHGTACIGSKHGSAKLSETDIPDIRERLRLGESRKSIARGYGVSHRAVKLIETGRTWRHV